MKLRQKVLVIGGGPAGLMAAGVLAECCEVHLFEKEKMPGRKFLLAGKGGLNLTNRLSGAELAAVYSPPGFMNNAILDYDSTALRNWLSESGVPTFVGSSGRVFPEKGITAAFVLNTILSILERKGVIFHLKHRLESFDTGMVFRFSGPEGLHTAHAGYAVLALGGASWPSTGSDGKWVHMANQSGLHTIDFEASNCGINIRWPENVLNHHVGKPLKNIRAIASGRQVRGEALITAYGLEGNAVYPLVGEFREQLARKQEQALIVDFKPENSAEQLLLKAEKQIRRPSDYAGVFKLSAAALAVIKAFTTKEIYTDPAQFAAAIKQIYLPVESLRPVEEAISTVGGLDRAEVNADFSLKKYPRIYAAGEMLDWDAPTGGFLLQGAFSTGYAAGMAILKAIADERS